MHLLMDVTDQITFCTSCYTCDRKLLLFSFRQHCPSPRLSLGHLSARGLVQRGSHVTRHHCQVEQQIPKTQLNTVACMVTQDPAGALVKYFSTRNHHRGLWAFFSHAHQRNRIGDLFGFVTCVNLTRAILEGACLHTRFCELGLHRGSRDTDHVGVSPMPASCPPHPDQCCIHNPQGSCPQQHNEYGLHVRLQQHGLESVTVTYIKLASCITNRNNTKLNLLPRSVGVHVCTGAAALPSNATLLWCAKCRHSMRSNTTTSLKYVRCFGTCICFIWF